MENVMTILQTFFEEQRTAYQAATPQTKYLLAMERFAMREFSEESEKENVLEFIQEVERDLEHWVDNPLDGLQAQPE